MAAAVQCVVSPGGSAWVRVTTRVATSGPSGGMRAGRVLSRRRPSTPSCAKRSCQRQTTDLDTLAMRMIAWVPSPSALSSTMRARQTCFCGVFPSATRAASQSRSEAESVTEMPLRIPLDSQDTAQTKIPAGLNRQSSTTRTARRGRSGISLIGVSSLVPARFPSIAWQPEPRVQARGGSRRDNLGPKAPFSARQALRPRSVRACADAVTTHAPCGICHGHLALDARRRPTCGVLEVFSCVPSTLMAQRPFRSEITAEEREAMTFGMSGPPRSRCVSR